MASAVTVDFIARKIAENENISNYEVILQDPNKKGEGYMGELKFFSLVDSGTKKVILDLAWKESLKNPLVREVHPIRDLYLNEIFFYKTLGPELLKVQKKNKIEKPIVNIPKYYLSCDGDMKEYLVLGNMKSEGYSMFDKNNIMTPDQYKFVFRQYGKLHGLSFAFKKQNPDLFKKLTEQILPGFDSEYRGFGESIHFACKSIYDFFSEADGGVLKAFEKYRDSGEAIFKKSLKYKGNNGIVTHGDSWSNNFLFTYDENGNFSKMAFIDFQCIRVASPVHDLAYCFYTGASKEVLDKLDEILKVYHESLSEVLGQCGENVEKVYPFSVLKEEWKLYSKMGMIFSFIIWKVKTRTPEEMIDVNDLLNDKKYLCVPNKTTYKTSIRNIVIHMHQIGAL
ncbi:unnamed protein product [Brassicogethes aeneus]|uniref:CHK kinase-like domain-containing protein n=1 Tax=Brassicogethes aeneus TaxID=1431903 RepID=A0A9P0F8L8_BRAAE|nr:unnamed protein product [Brassicogethes aeneus]